MSPPDPSEEERGSRFIKNRRKGAINEIEGWIALVKAETARVGAARSSQPSKNITEQMMLNSKLYEMSKQRFNFILHSQWQRKMFVDRQKKKTTLMRDLLRNVDLALLDPNSGAAERRRRAATMPGRVRVREPPAEPSVFITQSLHHRSLPEIAKTPAAPPTFPYPPSPEASATSRSEATPRSKATSVDTLTEALTQRKWPICDQRYLRLSNALCDNYPKHVVAAARRTSVLF